MADHLSHSQYSSLLYCAYQYFLERVARVPTVPSWFLVGGKTFHSATEWLDLNGHEADPKEVWEKFWDDEMKETFLKYQDVSISDYRAAGVTKANPRGQDAEYWFDLGPKMLEQYTAWVTQPGIEIQAAELDVACTFDNGIEFKGYLDRILVANTDRQIVDYKTGTAKPKNPMQLGFYRAALLQLGEPAPDKGAFFMARDGKLSYTEDLRLYTPDFVGKLLKRAKDIIDAGAFLPNPSFSCRSCSVQPYCHSGGGSGASQTDPLHPNYEGV